MLVSGFASACTHAMMGGMDELTARMGDYDAKVTHVERDFILHGAGAYGLEWLESTLLMTDAMMSMWGRFGLHCSNAGRDLETKHGRARLMLHRRSVSRAVRDAFEMVILSSDPLLADCGERTDAKGRAPRRVSQWHRIPGGISPGGESFSLDILFTGCAVDALVRMARFHEDTIRELLPAMRGFVRTLDITGKGGSTRIMPEDSRTETNAEAAGANVRLGFADSTSGVALTAAYRHLVAAPVFATPVLDEDEDTNGQNPVDAALIGLIGPDYIAGDRQYGFPWMTAKHPERRADMLAALMDPAFLSHMAPRITGFPHGGFLYDAPIALHALAMDMDTDTDVDSGNGAESVSSGLYEREKEYRRLMDAGDVGRLTVSPSSRRDPLPLMRSDTWRRIMNLQDWNGSPIGRHVIEFMGRMNTPPVKGDRPGVGDTDRYHCIPVVSSPEAADMIVDFWQHCAEGKSGCDGDRILDTLLDAEKTQGSMGSLADDALRLDKDGIAWIARRAFLKGDTDRLEAAVCMDYTRAMDADRETRTMLSWAERVSISRYCDAVAGAVQAMPRPFVAETLKSAVLS